MTFTIGRGNEIVCAAIRLIAERLKGRKINELFADMGKTWNDLVSDPQLRWIGPEKGVISIATGAVSNAIWDLYARREKKPLWKVSTHPSPGTKVIGTDAYFVPSMQLIVDFTPEEFVRSTVRPPPSILFFEGTRKKLITDRHFAALQCFRYITDAITPEEALAMLKEKEAGKAEREKSVIQTGYPAYTTSVG